MLTPNNIYDEFYNLRKDFFRTFEQIAHTKGHFPTIDKNSYYNDELAGLYRSLAELSNEAHLACRKLECINGIAPLEESNDLLNPIIYNWDLEEGVFVVYGHFYSTQTYEHYAEGYQIVSLLNEIRDAIRYIDISDERHFWKVRTLFFQIDCHIPHRPRRNDFESYFDRHAREYQLLHRLEELAPYKDYYSLLDFIRQLTILLRRIRLRWDSICKPHPYEKDPLGPCYACRYREQGERSGLSEMLRAQIPYDAPREKKDAFCKKNYQSIESSMALIMAVYDTIEDTKDNPKPDLETMIIDILNKLKVNHKKTFRIEVQYDGKKKQGGNSEFKLMCGPDPLNMHNLDMSARAMALFLTIVIIAKNQKEKMTTKDLISANGPATYRNLYKLIYNVIRGDWYNTDIAITEQTLSDIAREYHDAIKGSGYVSNLIGFKIDCKASKYDVKDYNSVDLSQKYIKTREHLRNIKISEDKKNWEKENTFMESLNKYAAHHGYSNDVIALLTVK